MQHVKRINLKKYFGLSLGSTLICALFLRDEWMILGLIIAYLATVWNQSLMLELTDDIAAQSKLKTEAERKKSFDSSFLVSSLLKTGVLFGGLTLSVHFMGNKIVIALLNYVLMIFILVFSLKKVEQNV